MEEQNSASIIESPREAELKEAEEKAKQLAAVEAEANREAIAAEKRKKILKISLFVFGGLLAAALLVALVWFIITIIFSVRTPAGNVGGSDEPPAAELPVIAGYQCKTETCNKVTDLPDGRMLLRDAAYYIYDSAEKVAVKTTISEKTYNAITPFVWGQETLAVLDPDTGRSALYSISRNQQIGGFGYDDFITDPRAAEYKGMEWIVGKYIIAKIDSAVRLLDVFDGAEVVRAQNKVFAYDAYFFGYDADGVRRAYLADGTRIMTAAKGDFLFVKDKRLIHVGGTNLRTMTLYDTTGKKIEQNDAYYASLQKSLSGSSNYAAAISAMSGTYTVAN